MEFRGISGQTLRGFYGSIAAGDYTLTYERIIGFSVYFENVISAVPYFFLCKILPGDMLPLICFRLNSIFYGKNEFFKMNSQDKRIIANIIYHSQRGNG